MADGPNIQETHSYVDVIAHRLNEVDQRLLKYSIDMNIKYAEQTKVTAAPRKDEIIPK